MPDSVVLCGEPLAASLPSLISHYGLTLCRVEPGCPIPGSFWGDSEAGLIANRLYVRADTPVHSALHEACHYICMDPQRRSGLHTDAGGDYDEENGVCYLQIVLADKLPGFGKAGMQADMDTWGYSFRLGSAKAWYERDAQDALEWLVRHKIVDNEGQPTWALRMDTDNLLQESK